MGAYQTAAVSRRGLNGVAGRMPGSVGAGGTRRSGMDVLAGRTTG